ncbi:S-layer homology domain-containing protein [Wukongibacter baidiensis]|uniref:YcdB/YcdC domain-containing protein n=1 Tax=Wukongibacter baidiensis TaxID=1723361 RepID=UPI003D7F46A5
MHKRKAVALTVSLMLTLGMVVPAFATIDTVIVEEKAVRVVDVVNEDTDMEQKEKEAKISKDQAIGIAKKTLKEYFNYDIDEKKFESRIEFREDYGDRGEYAWSIDWSMNNDKKSVNLDVWINANDGKIKRVSKYEFNHDDDEPTIAQITRDEAQVIAEEFIKRVNPKEYKEAKLEENDRAFIYRGGTNYNFVYTREINGVPFDGNSIRVEVDGVKSEVRGYNYSWDSDVQFPALERIINKEKAEQVLRDNIDMALSYIPNRNRYDYNNEKVKEIKLVYSSRFQNGYLVDAKEGTMLDYSGRAVEEEKVKNISDERKEEIFKNAKSVTIQDKEISQERASEVIGKYIKEIYGEGYELDSLRYVENDDYWETNGKKAWSARFEKDSGFRRRYGGKITINALTEELISARSYFDLEDEIEEGYKPAITWEQGYDKAIDAIAKYFPDKIKDIDTEAKYTKRTHYYNGKEMPETQYYYNFRRMVNGVYYSDDNISIEVGTKEGKVMEVRCEWNTEADFPETTGVIDKKDAKEIYFEEYKPELVYTKINKNDDYRNPDWEIKLVYRMSNRYFRGSNIDAFTGKFLGYDGEEVDEKDDKFKEAIKDHDSEKELSILASQGIIDTNEFELEKELTMDEAIKMLVDAKGYRPYMVRKAEALKFSNVKAADENYKYLQMAVQYGILENKESKYKGDEKITREDLAVMMVRLLGYEKLAEIDSIFKVSYKDAKEISDEKIGYVAICEGLKIMKDNNGKFEPKSNVKMVDMAIAIYNALGNLRGN